MGLDHVDRMLVLVITGIVGVVSLGCGGGTVGVMWSLPRVDCRVVIEVAKFCWLLKIGDIVDGAFKTSKRSVMINDNRLVADIVGSAHVVGKKSTVGRSFLLLWIMILHPTGARGCLLKS